MSSAVEVSTNPLISSGNNNSTAANPLKTDPELKRYLAELPEITSKKQFDRWRGCFLTRYELFLGQGGTGEAAPAYATFCEAIHKLSRLTQKVQEDLREDRLSVDHASVSARTRLTETQQHLQTTCQKLQALTPATLELEQELGYTKFQLGAMLVRDGFAEYQKLADCDAACSDFIGTSLKDIADRQLLEQMQDYQTKFAIFCDIMADLGLYQAMLKCHELNQLPPEPDTESEKEEEASVSSSSSSDGSLEPPKSPTKWEKEKEKDDKEEFNPYAFKMSFPSLKPPSGPFIKYVDTGAKSQDNVVKGVVPRGKLSSSELNYHHHNSTDSDQDSGSDNEEEACYKPVSKMEFKMNMDYHGGMNSDSWRVSKDGKVPNTQNKKMTTVKPKATTKSKKKKQPVVVESDNSSSDDQSTSSSSSSEESDDSIRRKKEARKLKKKKKAAAKGKQ